MSNDPESRIREIPEDQLSPAQKAAIEAVVGGRGRLLTPYKIWLHSPVLMRALEQLGTFLVKKSTLALREQELAIMLIAHHWKGEYVFAAHARAGREAGISDSVIEAIRNGAQPDIADPRERIIYEIATVSAEAGPASDEIFDRAIAAFGYDGVAELIAFLGYYSAVAMAMKLFRVPVPTHAPR